ncbi:uncharacterized protein RCO7_00554 [Rhynchosporium graminicola]|uniref:Uncharacterized protein n=1 Tax=Rhynchosporium graminicola TaxID=2792576 RepID=A0A1E1KQR3_9HELO|nr:uncharacterized protein RCO7_00554 [Rhynchosporium commune]
MSCGHESHRYVLTWQRLEWDNGDGVEDRTENLGEKIDL